MEEIGRGGMGRVYRARQRSLDRIVALKVIASDEVAAPKLVERFRIEAEAAASLDHPNIVPIYEVGEADGWHFFSMRLVEGQTLAVALARGPLPLAQGARLLATVARAISHAHQRGVLHRDLKPGNILLDSAGEPHVADFGLAKFTQRQSDLTITQAALGTPAYMSPEQAAGRTREITTAADVYGLGAVLFETLTGAPPFTGDTPMAIGRQVIDQEPPTPSSINPAVPRDLAVICLKCLEKDPGRRYRSAAGLADDLERWLRHEPISAHAATPAERLGKWVRRRPIHAALAVTLLLAVVGLVFGLVAHNHRITQAHQATQAASRQLAAHLRQVEWQQAEEALAAGRTADAMAAFARFLRETPGDLTAAKRLTSLLETRAFPLPALPPLRHGVPVNLLRMDRDGRRLFTVSDDGVLRSWSLADGHLENEARLDLGQTHLLGLPNAKSLLAVTKENGVILWDVERWRLQSRLGQIAPETGKLSLSDDGRYLSLIAPDNGVQLWDVGTATLLARTNLAEPNLSLAPTLGPQAETVIRGRLHGVWLWRPLKAELAPLLGVEEGPVYAACDWSRWRAYVSVENVHGNANGMVSLDLQTRQVLVRKLDAMPWHTIKASRDGKSLLVSRWVEGANVLDADTLNQRFPSFGRAPVLANVSADHHAHVAFRALHDGSGRLYNLSDGQPLMEPIQHEGTIVTHELSSDGRLLATGSQDGTARVWNLGMRSLDPTKLNAGFWINRIALSPDHQRLAMGVDRQARIYALNTWQALVPPVVAEDGVFDVAFSPDGEFLAAACFDHTLRMVNSKTGQTVWSNRDHRRRLWMAVFSRDGRYVGSGSEDGTARAFETTSGRPLCAPLRHEDSVTAFSFSPDRTLILTASVDATARLWDAETGAPRGPLFRHKSTVWDARFSPDGRRLVTASNDRTAQVWDVQTGEPVALPIRNDQGLMGARFSSDGQRILIWTLNGARIFDARTSQPLTPLMRHENRVTFADFSPNGRWVATGAEDNAARIWDARTGYPVTERLMHQGTVTSVIWLPDSQRLLTSSADGRVRIWPLPETESPPEWLPDLAEALGGKRDDGKGGRVSVPADRLHALRKVAEVDGDAPQNRWLRWFLLERVQSHGH
jgi:WD40 repeat protein